MSDPSRPRTTSITPSSKGKVVRSQKIPQIAPSSASSFSYESASENRSQAPQPPAPQPSTSQRRLQPSSREQFPSAAQTSTSSSTPRSHTPGQLTRPNNDPSRPRPADGVTRQPSQHGSTLSVSDAPPPPQAPPSSSTVSSNRRTLSSQTMPTLSSIARSQGETSDASREPERLEPSLMPNNHRGKAAISAIVSCSSAMLNSSISSASMRTVGGSSANKNTASGSAGPANRLRATSSQAPPSSIIPASRESATHAATGPPPPPPDHESTSEVVKAAPSSGIYWSRAPLSGVTTPPLRAHATTLVGSNVIVFGGCNSRVCFNKIYVLDADAFYWSAPHVTGDMPMPLRAMTCTAVGKRLVIFGGGDGPVYYNGVHVLDTGNYRWSRPRIVGSVQPSKRRAHTACLYKNGIYVFGGGDGIQALNDIWRLDVTDMNKMSWQLISRPTIKKGETNEERSGADEDDDTRPMPRGYHSANMVGSKLIIFGGSDGGECFQDVWIYDVDTHIWTPVTIPVTYRRLSHTANIVGSYLFVIGGHDGTAYSNDVLLLNLVTMTWDKRKVYGLLPTPRGYHGTVLYDSRLLAVGGFDGNEVFSDVWILELAVHSYYSQISHFTIDVG